MSEGSSATLSSFKTETKNEQRNESKKKKNAESTDKHTTARVYTPPL